MSNIPLYIYFIGLSFLVSLSVYFNHNNKEYPFLKTFPPFLLATLIAESYGAYLSSINKANTHVYNFFSVCEFCYYMVILSCIVNNRRARMVMRVTSVVYALVAISNILFFQGMKAFHTVTYSIGCLIVVIFCVYYFLELFRLPKSVMLTRNPAFWICSGLLFYYCCGFPLFAFIHLWMRITWVLERFDDIVTIINVFLYTLFIIAFLCNKTRKSSISPS